MNLSYNEAVRLRDLEYLDDVNDLYRNGRNAHASVMKTTSVKLVEKGLARYSARKVAKTGRVVQAGFVHITAEGRAAIEAHDSKPSR